MKRNKELLAVEEPKIARLLFGDAQFGWMWLPLRLYLGWSWLEAGWHKFIDPRWMGSGEALLDFWNRGLKMTPKPVIAIDWYRSFIEFLVSSGAHTWFSKVIIFGELAVALGLILGAFTGIAAFSGGLMNWSFIMAGSASTNGLLDGWIDHVQFSSGHFPTAVKFSDGSLSTTNGFAVYNYHYLPTGYDGHPNSIDYDEIIDGPTALLCARAGNRRPPG